jgi:hypothetical protein
VHDSTTTVPSAGGNLASSSAPSGCTGGDAVSQPRVFGRSESVGPCLCLQSTPCWRNIIVASLELEDVPPVCFVCAVLVRFCFLLATRARVCSPLPSLPLAFPFQRGGGRGISVGRLGKRTEPVSRGAGDTERLRRGAGSPQQGGQQALGAPAVSAKAPLAFKLGA